MDLVDEHKYDIFISNSQLIDTDPEELVIGMPIQALLKPVEQLGEKSRKYWVAG